jgi:hypothetical protein
MGHKLKHVEAERDAAQAEVDALTAESSQAVSERAAQYYAREIAKHQAIVDANTAILEEEA